MAAVPPHSDQEADMSMSLRPIHGCMHAEIASLFYHLVGAASTPAAP